MLREPNKRCDVEIGGGGLKPLLTAMQGVERIQLS